MVPALGPKRKAVLIVLILAVVIWALHRDSSFVYSPKRVVSRPTGLEQILKSQTDKKHFQKVFTIFEVGEKPERGYVALMASIVASIVMQRKVDMFSTTVKVTPPSFDSKFIRIVRYTASDLVYDGGDSQGDFGVSRYRVHRADWCRRAWGEDLKSTNFLRLAALTSFTDMMRLVMCDNDCFYFDADAMVLRPPMAGVSMLPLTSFIDSDGKNSKPTLIDDPHLNNNYFSFQESPYYEQVMNDLVKTYAPKNWGSLGSVLFERTWTKMNCSSAQHAQKCPLVYGAPFTLFPGVIRHLPSWKKYMDQTQSVVHHYSVAKDLSYFVEYLSLLLDKDTFEKAMKAFHEEKDNYVFAKQRQFNPVSFVCPTDKEKKSQLLKEANERQETRIR